MTHTLHRLTKRLANAAIDIASWSIAQICDAYPSIEHRREIHMLRLRCNSYEMRCSELELELDGYKTMHEMAHGSTIPSLPDPPDSGNHRDLN